jgi:hypothetical protein
MNLYGIFSFVLAIGIGVSLEAAQPVDSASKREAIEANLLLSAISENGFQGSVDIGALDPGKKYQLMLNVANPSKFAYEFKKIQVGCACSKVKTSTNRFPAEKTVELLVDFETPGSSKDGSFDFNFTFHNEEVPFGMIVIKSMLAGNLFIDQSKSIFSITSKEKGVASWRVPVRFSAPVTKEKLKLEKSDGIEEVACEVVSQNGNFFIEFLVGTDVIPDLGLTGSVTLADEDVGVTNKLEFLVLKKPPVTISPRFIRFQKTTVKGKEVVKANVLIRANPESNRIAKKKLASSPNFACSIGDVRKSFPAKQLAANIHRVELHFELEELPESGEGAVVWSLVHSGEIFEIQTKFKVIGK